MRVCRVMLTTNSAARDLSVRAADRLDRMCWAGQFALPGCLRRVLAAGRAGSASDFRYFCFRCARGFGLLRAPGTGVDGCVSFGLAMSAGFECDTTGSTEMLCDGDLVFADQVASATAAHLAVDSGDQRIRAGDAFHCRHRRG